MFSLFGAPALSKFRLDKLLHVLKTDEPRVRGLAARWVHFVDATRALDERELQVLEKLLTYGARDSDLRASSGSGSGGHRSDGHRSDGHRSGGHRILVTPRLGTESPWSSKATDIVHVCGLDAVRRVERGTVYFIQSTAALEQAELRRLAVHLHDRMTESIWIDSIDPEGLFHGAAARPLRIVTLGADGHAALSRANRDWGLALSNDEIDYLVAAFRNLKRDPTDVELMM